MTEAEFHEELLKRVDLFLNEVLPVVKDLKKLIEPALANVEEDSFLNEEERNLKFMRVENEKKKLEIEAAALLMEGLKISKELQDK